ncbi:MAG: CsgG/HfaB family protein [Armatimonadota bacterium]
MLGLPAPLRAQEQPLDTAAVIAGNIEKVDGKVSIAGNSYAYYLTSPELDSFAVFDVRGWDHFTAWIGVSDTGRTPGAQKTVIEVDDTVAWRQDVAAGGLAKYVDIPLAGKSTLVLRWTSANTVFAEAKLVKGNPLPPFACPLCDKRFRTLDAITDHVTTVHDSGKTPPESITANSFSAHPDDLDTLAIALRNRVDAKADLKAKLANGAIAVMPFKLIDVASPSVAQILAEDLSASFIKHAFLVVERERIDKALKELNIRNAESIDEPTAHKLSELTGCAFILIGSISDLGPSFSINARLLEIDTNKTVAAERVECRKIAGRAHATIRRDVFTSCYNAFCAKQDYQSAVDFVGTIEALSANYDFCAEAYLRIAEKCYQSKSYNEAICVYEYLLSRQADYLENASSYHPSLILYRCATAYYREGLRDTNNKTYLGNAIVKYLDYVKQYPDEELVDDALYWAANAFLKLNNPQQACNVLHWLLTDYKDADMVQYAQRLRDKITDDKKITTATKIQVPDYVEIPRNIKLPQ